MVWLLLHTAFAGLEICDGEDNDGDGSIDESPHLVFVDADGDGFGDPESFVALDTPCQQPNAVPPTDCDDGEQQAHPGGIDTCDGIDNDCDGEIDGGFCLPCAGEIFEGNSYLRCGLLVPQRSWSEAQAYCVDRGYALAVPDSAAEQTFLEDRAMGADRWIGLQDLDGDGAFLTWDALVPASLSWAPGEPLVLGSGTCALVVNDPPDPGLYAQDCDAAAGWLCEVACPLRNWYLDEDGDGQGTGVATAACTAPPDHVAIPGDCDDLDPERHSTASEVCNGVDDDCDGAIDEYASSSSVWYDDLDGDGAGDPATGVASCSPLPGQVDVAGDCAPDDPAVHPGADEICNGTDDDCDGDTDEDDPDLLDGLVWFEDGDGDGFGSAEQIACSQPLGAVAVGGDCADGDPAVNPDAEEICDFVDDDCNGIADDITSGGAVWYPDEDGDGLGDGNIPQSSCAAPTGWIADGSDCDDTDPNIGYAPLWYLDGDGDGHPGPETATACAPPAGSGTAPVDCDDSDPDVYPGAAETCNQQDDDCDGRIDEDPVDGVPWYVDGDGDGFGGASSTLACDPPVGATGTPGDCDDTDATVNPDAQERCNGVDDDCDALIDDADPDLESGSSFFVDADGDGFGAARVEACARGADLVTVDGDCDDDAADRYPGAVEIGDDGVDQDCDGSDLAYTYGNGGDCGCSSTRAALPVLWRR